MLLAESTAFRLPLLILNADVKSAFASLTLAELAEALCELGAPARLVLAILEEMEVLTATATVADAPPSSEFPFHVRWAGGRL